MKFNAEIFENAKAAEVVPNHISDLIHNKFARYVTPQRVQI